MLFFLAVILLLIFKIYQINGGRFVSVNAAKLGAPLKGVVSFHGWLVGVPFKKDLIRGKILICQGGEDEFAPPVDQRAFKKSMDSLNAQYSFIVYPHAKHAYTNPESTELGLKFNMPLAYDAAADSASWKDMQVFCSRFSNRFANHPVICSASPFFPHPGPL